MLPFHMRLLVERMVRSGLWYDPAQVCGQENGLEVRVKRLLVANQIVVEETVAASRRKKFSFPVVDF